jgi:hypothetical protein
MPDNCGCDTGFEGPAPGEDKKKQPWDGYKFTRCTGEKCDPPKDKEGKRTCQQVFTLSQQFGWRPDCLCEHVKNSMPLESIEAELKKYEPGILAKDPKNRLPRIGRKKTEDGDPCAVEWSMDKKGKDDVWPKIYVWCGILKCTETTDVCRVAFKNEKETDKKEGQPDQEVWKLYLACFCIPKNLG